VLILVGIVIMAGGSAAISIAVSTRLNSRALQARGQRNRQSEDKVPQVVGDVAADVHSG
jgi:hypothetical protein